MKRYNIFNNVHKGLRAALYQTALKIQQTDFLSGEEAEEAVCRIREVTLLFDGHAQKEDQFILPAIQTYEPSVVDAFEAEHQKDLELSRQLTNLIQKLEDADTADEKAAAGGALSRAFVAFTVFNLQHMAKEEDLINNILWRYYSDGELEEISRQIAAATPPWIQHFYAAWMLRGLNTRETISWLKTVDRQASRMVFEDLYAASEKELSPSRFQRVRRAFSPAPAIM